LRRSVNSCTALAAASCLALAAPLARAQGEGDALLTGIGARERVLGAAVAAADPAAAIAWNPALLAQAGGAAVHAHFAPLPEGANLDAVTAAWPFGPGVLGGGLTRLGAGDIATFDAQGVPTGNATFADVELALGYGLRLLWPFAVEGRSAGQRTASGTDSLAASSAPSRRGLDLGLALRYRRQSLAEHAGAGFGLDLGVAFEPRPGIALGFRARNLLSPSVTLYESAERQPRALSIGGAYARMLGGRPWLMCGEAVVGASDAPLAFGLEVPVAFGLLGRAGLAGSKPRAGVGFAAGFITLDYGLESHDLGLVHQVSVTARLGEGATARRREELAAREAERAAIASEAAERALSAAADQLRTRALAAPTRTEARSAWLALLTQRPGNAEARAALAELDVQDAAARADSLRLGAESRRAETEAERGAARAAEERNDLAGAALHWSRVVALFPDDAAAMAGLARVRDRLALESDSLSVTRQNLEERELDLARHRAEVVRLTSLVRALEAQAAGDLKRARAIADSLLRAHPRDPAALAVSSKAGQPTALDDPKLHDQARRLYIEGMRRFNVGDYSGAIRYWEELMALDPANPAVRMNLEEARARQGAGR
jgi:tetratricopeptide (TPR) repeat protein